jgi:hypothetical protein
MRLANLDRDHWQLKENPDWEQAVSPAFSKTGTRQLPVGHTVKLHFEMNLLDRRSGTEHRAIEKMWVAVVDRIGDAYIGLLTNEPRLVERSDLSILFVLMEVPFCWEHIWEYQSQSDDAAAWIMTVEPNRTWPRDY